MWYNFVKTLVLLTCFIKDCTWVSFYITIHCISQNWNCMVTHLSMFFIVTIPNYPHSLKFFTGEFWVKWVWISIALFLFAIPENVKLHLCGVLLPMYSSIISIFKPLSFTLLINDIFISGIIFPDLLNFNYHIYQPKIFSTHWINELILLTVILLILSYLLVY